LSRSDALKKRPCGKDAAGNTLEACAPVPLTHTESTVENENQDAEPFGPKLEKAFPLRALCLREKIVIQECFKQGHGEETLDFAPVT
jgi:hypothetical protein